MKNEQNALWEACPCWPSTLSVAWSVVPLTVVRGRPRRDPFFPAVVVLSRCRPLMAEACHVQHRPEATLLSPNHCQGQCPHRRAWGHSHCHLGHVLFGHLQVSSLARVCEALVTDGGFLALKCSLMHLQWAPGWVPSLSASDPGASGGQVPIPWAWEGQLACFWSVTAAFAPVPSVASAIGQ